MKVLSVLAHPDDECIFGWPIFQNRQLEKRLIVLASDRHNPQREWCQNRRQALQDICQLLDVRVYALDFDSEFYRLPYRRADTVMSDLYTAMERTISEVVAEFRPDFVFTHNPHGEYGAMDHRIVFDFVYTHAPVENLCITDICEKHSDWFSFDTLPERELDLYYRGKPNAEVALDPDFYLSCKQIYDRYGCWTWKSKTPPDYPASSCRLYFTRTAKRFSHDSALRLLAANTPAQTSQP